MVFLPAAMDKKSGNTSDSRGPVITLKGENGVRYTVPSMIFTDRMEETLTVRFRVSNVFKDAAICTYFGDTCVSRRKKRVLAPGEMENIILKKKDIKAAEGLSCITIRIEQQ